jgi:CRP-like cAMP-binding protein
VSEQGKEAVIAILEPDQFFGEGCLLDNPIPEAAEAPITNPLNSWKGKESIISRSAHRSFSGPLAAHDAFIFRHHRRPFTKRCHSE